MPGVRGLNLQAAEGRADAVGQVPTPEVRPSQGQRHHRERSGTSQWMVCVWTARVDSPEKDWLGSMHQCGFDCELAANRHQRQRGDSSNPELIDRLQVSQCESADSHSAAHSARGRIRLDRRPRAATVTSRLNMRDTSLASAMPIKP